MAATDTIGVAFLGVGRMGETHLRNIAGLHGVRVVAVADPRPEAAERGKALANAEAALTDIDRAKARIEAGDLGRLETFRALQAGRKPSPGPEDALETLRLAVAVTKNWREQRPVKVAEIQA